MGMYKEKHATVQSLCILQSTGGYGSVSYNVSCSSWRATPSWQATITAYIAEKFRAEKWWCWRPLYV